MAFFSFLSPIFTPQNRNGSEDGDVLFGSFFDDVINGRGGDDLIIGLAGKDDLNGGDGDDGIFGGVGHDVIAGNKGNDVMFGGLGNDLLVWNNGDGSDLIDGSVGYDRQQVNFDTDLVNTDLQNDDVAEFSSTEDGIKFARVELNGQTERGLFQLDIQNTEVQETNFGGGNDEARIVGDVLQKIKLDLDGGDGVDTLDLSQVNAGVSATLKGGFINSRHRAENFENAIGTEFDDTINGSDAANVISGLGGDDYIFGDGGNDVLIGGKGSDEVFGGQGDDLLVWNNGDGSDLLVGGNGYDRVQVNFNTDLVDNDLQNDDVADFSVTPEGVQFARIEVNDQTERGLFQLDIRKTEALETNFGGGDDTAQVQDGVLEKIRLDLDGGDGVDTLDLSAIEGGANNLGLGIDLNTGTVGGSSAVNFENVVGTSGNDVIIGTDGDNVIRGAEGNDIMLGGDGADTFVFFEADVGIDFILDFEVGVDRLQFVTNDGTVTPQSILDGLSQNGDDVDLTLNGKTITLEDTQVADFAVDDFFVV